MTMNVCGAKAVVSAKKAPRGARAVSLFPYHPDPRTLQGCAEALSTEASTRPASAGDGVGAVSKRGEMRRRGGAGGREAVTAPGIVLPPCRWASKRLARLSLACCSSLLTNAGGVQAGALPFFRFFPPPPPSCSAKRLAGIVPLRWGIGVLSQSVLHRLPLVLALVMTPFSARSTLALCVSLTHCANARSTYARSFGGHPLAPASDGTRA